MQSDQPLMHLLPGLVAELAEALRQCGREDVAAQLDIVGVRHFTHEESADAGYLYLTESRPLNSVEQNIIGVKHGQCIHLDLPGTVMIDVDNFGRIQGIELLGYREVFRSLDAGV